MKIAITGGAGFIGSHLVKDYLDAGHDVIVIDSLIHDSARAIDPRARFYQLDIRDDKLRTILQQERPEIVSHHAALRESLLVGEQPLADADIHVRGLLHLLDCCVSASVKKFIFASGGNDLYGRVELDQLPLPETTALVPRRPLDISKIAGEWYTRYYSCQFGLEHTILRYADVYGGRTEDIGLHPINYFITQLRAGRRPIIRGSGDDVRDHIFIDDVVRANRAALERAKNQTLHISSSQGVSMNQIFELVADLFESDLRPTYVSNSLGDPAITILDNTRARQSLCWQPLTSLTEGVQRSVASSDRAESLQEFRQGIHVNTIAMAR